MSNISDIEKTSSSFLDYAQSQLQSTLLELYDDAMKEELKTWVSSVALLQKRIITEGYTDSLKLTESYLKIGVQSFLRKVKTRAEDSGITFLEKFMTTMKDMFSGFLQLAISAAVAGAVKAIL